MTGPRCRLQLPSSGEEVPPVVSASRLRRGSEQPLCPRPEESATRWLDRFGIDPLRLSPRRVAALDAAGRDESRAAR